MDPKTLLSKAANGDTTAQFELANYYRSSGDLATSVHWLQAAAKGKHLYALTNLAICYFFGDGIEQSYEKAFPLFQQGSTLGDVSATYYLGLSFLNGNGVPADPAKGFNLLLETARKGMPWAQLSLANCYENGLATKVDLFEAVSWYARASEQGIKEAQEKFNALYYSNHFVDDSGQQRWFWFEKGNADK